MTTRELLAQLQTQLDQGRVPREQEVVVRLAGRDYTVRRLDASTAAL